MQRYEPPKAASRYRRWGAAGVPGFYWPLHLGLCGVRQCPCGPSEDLPLQLAVRPDWVAPVARRGVQLYLQLAAAERAAAGQPLLPQQVEEEARQRLEAYVMRQVEPLTAQQPGGGGSDGVEGELWDEVHSMRSEEQQAAEEEEQLTELAAARREWAGVYLRLRWLEMTLEAQAAGLVV